MRRAQHQWRGEDMAVSKNRHCPHGPWSAEDDTLIGEGGKASLRSEAYSEICRVSRRALSKEEKYRADETASVTSIR